MPNKTSVYDELWKTKYCGQGKECWCRAVFTKSGREVLSGAHLGKILASYLVRLHNRSLKPSKYLKEVRTPKNSSVHDKLWRTICCHVGKGCWCREIYTRSGKAVLYEGCLGKELVFYLVKLHNKSVRAKGVSNG